ncbi:MAG: hypothetical protein ACE5GJ_04195 [Gemmatimonadota bacterium]
MIQATVRASIGRADALQLVALLGRHDREILDAARARLEDEGVDALLDDPRVLNALLTECDVTVRPEVIFYVLVRQVLLEAGVQDRTTADYVASLVLRFGQGRRAYRVSSDAEEEYRYLVDMVARLSESGGREAFLLNTHMGDYALWLTGLFPDFVESRTRRRGAPPVRYYETVGSTGYRTAAESREAERLGMDRVLKGVARHFSGARAALNTMADRHLWPGGGDPVGRLLREVTGRAR